MKLTSVPKISQNTGQFCWGFVSNGLSVFRGASFTHSKVVARQIEKECIAREPTIEKYLSMVRRIEFFSRGFTIEYIDRNKNVEVDELAKAVARNTPLLADVFLQIISDTSIKTIKPKPKVINIIHAEDRRALIMAYLHHYYEPNSTVERRMQQRAQSYQIVNIELYKISVSDRLLHYFSKTKGQQILSEVHTRVCGGHIGAEALAAKTLQQGFYWLGMIDDAVKLVSTCEACQRFSRKMKAPI
jgi:hypothetical protein